MLIETILLLSLLKLLITPALCITLANLKQLIYKNSVLEGRGLIYKKYCLRFFIFVYSLYKMVARMSIYKSLNINIETVMKNPEMLNFALDHFKTNKMCE